MEVADPGDDTEKFWSNTYQYSLQCWGPTRFFIENDQSGSLAN